MFLALFSFFFIYLSHAEEGSYFTKEKWKEFELTVCRCLPTQYKKFQSYQTLLLVTISKLSLKQFSKTFLDCFTLTDLIWSPTQFLKVSCSKEQSEDIEMERINKYELLASLPTKESPESQHTGCCNYKWRISICSLFPRFM